MISVSGKYWEEEKISNRAVEKTKLENNFQEFT